MNEQQVSDTEGRINMIPSSRYACEVLDIIEDWRRLKAGEQQVADLVTIVDFCNEMATSIRNDYTDPRSEARAIWDAHDMAHVLTGGDRTRKPWSVDWTLGDGEFDEEQFSPAASDVFRRMKELRDRMELTAPQEIVKR